MRRRKNKPQTTGDENAERIFTEAFDRLPDGTDEGLVEAALQIAEKRKKILLQLKDAIERDDFKEAKRLIRQLVPDDVRT